jgi:hypothetical protein
VAVAFAVAVLRDRPLAYQVWISQTSRMTAMAIQASSAQVVGRFMPGAYYPQPSISIPSRSMSPLRFCSRRYLLSLFMQC